MAQVAFWGLSKSQTGSTSIAASIACMLALEYDYKNLLLSTNFMDNSLETSFIDIKKLTARKGMDFTDIGLDALERVVKSGKLEAKNIVDYTSPILKDRLDVMFGTQKEDKDMYNRIMLMLPSLLRVSAKIYDICLVDVKTGKYDEVTQEILRESDLIIVNINQTKASLDEFFHKMQEDPILKDKKFFLVLGRYDRYSKFNAKNIASLYHYKKPIFTLPYNTQFFDMQNDHRMLEFFIKYLNAHPADRNGFFVNEIKRLSKAIMDNIVISTDR